MNAGAAQATAEVLVFLHADTCLPPDAAGAITGGLARAGREWGRFDVHIEGRQPMLKVVAWMMNLRSRLSGICTGDQALFVRREVFEQLGGFPVIDLMEDIALSAKLRRRSAPLALREQVLTSGRRWEKHGVWRTIALMWWLRLRYFLGASPRALRRAYDADSR
jgi:rSAM/selenodomain-associated transferase 2